MGDENGSPTDSIPHDLVIEILSILPVKSLMRFTCVCKAWLGLIRNDHHFAMKQLLRRTTLPSNVLDRLDYVFYVQQSGKTCLYSLSEAKTFHFFKRFECIPDIPMGVSNTCHGIMCFTMPSKSKILLCNPSIKEVVLLPPCPIHSSSTAIGFDPINKDYKVVVIAARKFNKIMLCNVYSVRHGRWQDVHVSASLIATSKFDYAAVNENGRKCNWLIWKTLENRKVERCLLTFDMVEEVLKDLPLPDCSRQNEPHKHQLVSTTKWQACLTCMYKSSNDIVDVWVLKSDDCDGQVWNKEFVVKLPVGEPVKALDILLSDDELLVLMKKKHSNVDSQNDPTMVFHYDQSTLQLKSTGHSRRRMDCFSKGYVESLVSIKLFMRINDNSEPNDQAEASKQKERSEYMFCEAGRKDIRWSFKFN